MNQLYLYLYAEPPTIDEQSNADATRSIIGDFDTRQPPATEPQDEHFVLLSLV